MNNAPTLYIPRNISLPSDSQWQYKIEIKSETSNRLYVVSQNIKHKHWGCSCPGYKRYRKCKHLTAMGLPGNEQPYTPKIIVE